MGLSENDVKELMGVMIADDKIHNELLMCASERERLDFEYEWLENFEHKGETLGSYLINNPDSFFKILREVVNETLHLPEDDFVLYRFGKKINWGELIKSRIHIVNIPKNLECVVKISDLRHYYENKFIVVPGTVKIISSIQPTTVEATYECYYCGNRIVVFRDSEGFLKLPKVCGGCGKRVSEDAWILVEEKKIDTQRVWIEEFPEDVDVQTRDLECVIEIDDLLDQSFQKYLIPGRRVWVYGILRCRKQKVKKKRSAIETFYLEVNNIEFEDEYVDVQPTPEELKQIKEIAKREDVLDYLANIAFPTIKGHDHIKKALILALVGGVKKVQGADIRRDTIHVLIVGDPGRAKTALMRNLTYIAPKWRYASGRSASAAGLTATVTRDEATGSWRLEVGTVVLAHKGVAILDEVDKMTEVDRSALLQIMEHQRFPIDKAGVHGELKAETSIICAANPKYGEFDKSTPPKEQINLPVELLDRFDLIFVVMKKDYDEEITKHILKVHRGEIKIDKSKLNLVKKYIAYAKKLEPKLTDEAAEYILEYCRKFYEMQKAKDDTATGLEPRDIEALIRLSEACAKLRLSDKVEVEDVERALDVFEHYLNDVVLDPSDGLYDPARIRKGVPKSERKIAEIVLYLLDELKGDNGLVDKHILIKKLEEDYKIPQVKSEKVIEMLIREGDICEPNSGKLLRV